MTRYLVATRYLFMSNATTTASDLSLALARAEKHLVHIQELRAAGPNERRLLDVGVDALTADTLVRMPWLLPTARHETAVAS